MIVLILVSHPENSITQERVRALTKEAEKEPKLLLVHHAGGLQSLVVGLVRVDEGRGVVRRL